MKGIKRFIQTIKNVLKHIFPPPVASFMREVGLIKQAAEHLNIVIEHSQERQTDELAAIVQQVQLLRRETDALKTELQAMRPFQKKLEEHLTQQTALIREMNQNIIDDRKQVGNKITVITRRLDVLDNREKRLVQDKRLLEQVVLGTVPNFESVTLELTNHCAYNCIFCPREQMTRSRGVMKDESIRIVARRLGAQAGKNIIVWTDGMGEVMLLDEFFDKISLIKSVMPNAMPFVVTTLGYEKEDPYWDALLQVGIKRIMISMYGYDKEAYQLLHGINRYDLALSNLELLVAKNQALGCPVEIEVSVENFGKDFFSSFKNFDYERHAQLRERFINTLEGMPSTTVLRRKIHNRGQAFHFASPKAGNKKCFVDSYPTRQSKLYITWNLNVLPCPMIFNDEIVFGNLEKQSLEEIYSSDAYKNFLCDLQNKRLTDYPSCQNCNM